MNKPSVSSHRGTRSPHTPPAPRPACGSSGSCLLGVGVLRGAQSLWKEEERRVRRRGRVPEATRRSPRIVSFQHVCSSWSAAPPCFRTQNRVTTTQLVLCGTGMSSVQHKVVTAPGGSPQSQGGR